MKKKLSCFVLTLGVALFPIAAQILRGISAAENIDNKIVNWTLGMSDSFDVVAAFFALGSLLMIFFHYMQGNEQGSKSFIKLLVGLAIFKLMVYFAGIIFQNL